MISTEHTNETEKTTFSEKYFVAVLVSAVVTATLFCFSDGISGNDYWWHIKVGEWIWQQKSIPHTDIFSWYGIEHEIAYVPHEWLSDVIFYLLQKVFGGFGVFIVSFFASVALVLLSMKRVGKNLFRNAAYSALFFCLYAVTATLFFYGRPQIFGIYLLFFALYCLQRFYHNPESKCIWWLPLIGCLWSNLHGGSSNLSYLLCAGFLVCGLMKLNIGKLYAERRPRRWLKIMLVVTGLTTLSVLVNPIGLKVFAYPYENMADAFMLTIIREWVPPDAKKPGDLILYFLPVFMVVVSLIVTDKKVRLLDLFILLFFIFIFFRSIRFIIYFYIAASLFAFEYFPKWKLKEIKTKLEKVVVFTFFGLIAFGIISNAEKVVPRVSDGTLISTVMDEEVIRIVKEENPSRLFNDYDFGEMLIYHDIPVFFDSRADVFSAANTLKDGISLTYMQPTDSEMEFDVDALMNKYQFDGYLVSVTRPLYAYLSSHPDRYLRVYSDDTAGYFRVLR